MDIDQLEEYTALRCVPHYDYGIFTRFLVICQFFPLYLTIGMYAVTLTYKYQEVYYRFFSLGLTLNWLLNLALQYIIQSEPHIHNCGGGYSMPSWHAQHVFFFYTVLITYFILKKKHIGAFNLMLLNSIPALVCASRLTLGFNTFSELMVGNIIGVTFGFFYQVVLFTWVKPNIPKLLQFRICKWLGYTDHFFFTDEEDSGNDESLGSHSQAFGGRVTTCVLCQLDLYHPVHY